MDASKLCFTQMIFPTTGNNNIFTIRTVREDIILSENPNIWDIRWDCQSSFFRLCEHLCIDDRSSGRMLEKSHFGIEIILEIRVPVEVIGLEIGENRVSSLKFLDIVRHETRNFDDDVTLLESPLPYQLDCLRERHIKIPREENLIVPILLSEKLIEDPRRRRFPVRPRHGKDFKAFRQKWIDEIKFSHNLARRIDPVGWGDTGRRDNRTITRKILNIIRIIHDLRLHLLRVTKRLQGVSDFSFAVNTDHNLEKMRKYSILEQDNLYSIYIENGHKSKFEYSKRFRSGIRKSYL